MTTRNRGKEGRDDELFGTEKARMAICNAVADISYLLGKGYNEKSSVALAGNRYKLNTRQQKAVRGIAASIDDVKQRNKKEVSASFLTGKNLDIDGFNLLILLETAYSGGYLFKGMDGAYRDLSSVHGSYKRVTKTMDVLEQVGHLLKTHNVGVITWYFDTPVSNSGRLQTILGEFASTRNFNWRIELVFNPDKVLAQSTNVVVSSDAYVLNECQNWFNLPELLINTDWNIFKI